MTLTITQVDKDANKQKTMWYRIMKLRIMSQKEKSIMKELNWQQSKSVKSQRLK